MQKIKFGTTFITENELKHFEFDKSFIGKINKHNLYCKEKKLWVLIKKAGDFFIDEDLSLIEKENIKSFCVVDEHVELLLNQYFEQFQVNKKSDDSKALADLFFKTLVNDVFLNSSVSIFTYVYTCFQHFSSLPKDFFHSNKSVSRSLLTSSFNVYNALLLGITDYKFLKDIYNVSYLFDLSVSKIDFKTAQLYFENKKEDVSSSDQAIYENHLFESFEMAQVYKDYFSNRNILDLIVNHHERIDAKGFPFGASYKSMTLVQSIISFAEQIFDYNSFEYGAQDTTPLLIAKIAAYSQSLQVKCTLVNYWNTLFREYYSGFASLTEKESA